MSSSTFTNIRIDLSTTSAEPDNLSTTFANNVGADDTVVYSGELKISTAMTRAAGMPYDFDIVINLTTPYLYDPDAGNLLLDVRNYHTASVGALDAHTITGDGVSRVYSRSSGTVNSASGYADSLGLITRFTATPVPEPTAQPALRFIPFRTDSNYIHA